MSETSSPVRAGSGVPGLLPSGRYDTASPATEEACWAADSHLVTVYAADRMRINVARLAAAMRSARRTHTIAPHEVARWVASPASVPDWLAAVRGQAAKHWSEVEEDAREMLRLGDARIRDESWLQRHPEHRAAAELLELLDAYDRVHPIGEPTAPSPVDPSLTDLDVDLGHDAADDRAADDRAADRIGPSAAPAPIVGPVRGGLRLLKFEPATDEDRRRRPGHGLVTAAAAALGDALAADELAADGPDETPRQGSGACAGPRPEPSSNVIWLADVRAARTGAHDADFDGFL